MASSNNVDLVLVGEGESQEQRSQRYLQQWHMIAANARMRSQPAPVDIHSQTSDTRTFRPLNKLQYATKSVSSREERITSDLPKTTDSASTARLFDNKEPQNLSRASSAIRAEVGASIMPETFRPSALPHSVFPLEVRDGKELSRDEMLAQARKEQLRTIHLRNRAKDKDATTSLGDLDLARKPARIPQNDTSKHTNQETQSNRLALDEYDEFGSPGDRESNGVLLPKSTVGNEKSQWASKNEMQPIGTQLDAEVDSNAWGSSIPSDASQESMDSIQPLHFGKLLRNKPPKPQEQPLTGWDGKLQPPPIDWDDRPRFNNNRPDFRDSFARWTADVVNMTQRTDDVYFSSIPNHVIEDTSWHADGIGLVKCTRQIDDKNAGRYGYVDLGDIAKYCQPISLSDFDDWGKLDLTRMENSAIKNETTNDLVKNWLANTRRRRDLAEQQQEVALNARAVMKEYKAEPNPNAPAINIYLRPAVKLDCPQMTEIYNWYIEHSPRPVEMVPIDESDMLARLELSKSNKLPIVVAVAKSKSNAIALTQEASFGAQRANGLATVGTDHSARIMEKHEKVVGWASASDFTAADYVERISVELEVFVDSQYRSKGVGRCLLDKIIEALDRGYVKKGGYMFHCAQEIRHMYSPGGARDIHKIMLLIRRWTNPRDVSGRSIREDKDVIVKERRADRENDYEYWLREWLESWDFRVEGILSEIGVKNGRFLDTVYLGRTTGWQPEDGKIADPLPGTY